MIGCLANRKGHEDVQQFRAKAKFWVDGVWFVIVLVCSCVYVSSVNFSCFIKKFLQVTREPFQTKFARPVCNGCPPGAWPQHSHCFLSLLMLLRSRQWDLVPRTQPEPPSLDPSCVQNPVLLRNHHCTTNIIIHRKLRP